MSGEHSHLLYRHGDSPVHRLPAHVKIVALVVFVLVVVATPRELFVVFVVDAVLLGAVGWVARVPAGFVARRLVVEFPVLVFALLLPIVSTGERVSVAGLSLSAEGLLAGWNILAKATLGMIGAVLLAATTDLRSLLTGLQRLRLPATLVEIMSFMTRYTGVVVDDLQRMRIAREARGFDPRHLGHARAVARGAGVLFVRSYERGERVHLAMLSRGYAGTMPLLRSTPATTSTGASAWVSAAALPLAACLAAVVGGLLA